MATKFENRFGLTPMLSDMHRYGRWLEGEQIWEADLSTDQVAKLEKLANEFSIHPDAGFDGLLFGVVEAVVDFQRLQRDGAGDLGRAATRRLGGKHLADVQSQASSLASLLRSEEFKNYNQLYLSRGYPNDDDSLFGVRLEQLRDVRGGPETDRLWTPFNLARFLDSLSLLADLAGDGAETLSKGQGKTPNAIERYFARDIAWLWDTYGTESIAPRRSEDPQPWRFREFLRAAGGVVDSDFNGKGAADWVYARYLQAKKLASEFQ